MTLAQLQKCLANGKVGYTASDVTPFVKEGAIRRLEAAVAFANARRLFDDELERCVSKSGKVIFLDMDGVFSELTKVGVISKRKGDHELALLIGKQLKQFQGSGIKTADAIGCALTHLQRLFLEYGIFIGEFGVGLTIPKMTIRTELEDIHIYMKASGEGAGRAGEFYQEEWGARPVIGLDISKAVANIRIMSDMVDTTDYAKGLEVSSEDFGEESRRRLEEDREWAGKIKNAATSFLYGRTLYQAFDRAYDDDPEKWFLNLVNAHIGTMLAHEKTHARLHHIKAKPDSEVTEEYIAMLGQLAFGPKEMALAQIIATGSHIETAHTMARERVMHNLFVINGIYDSDPRTIPDMLDLTPDLLAQSARRLLVLLFERKSYSEVEMILQTREIERLVSTRFVTPQDIALLDIVKHDPNIV